MTTKPNLVDPIDVYAGRAVSKRRTSKGEDRWVFSWEVAGKGKTRSFDTKVAAEDFRSDIRAALSGRHREMFDAVTFTRFDELSLTATLTGIAPASFDEDVKAVTYHEADVVFDGDSWRTTLVFDI